VDNNTKIIATTRKTTCTVLHQQSISNAYHLHTVRKTSHTVNTTVQQSCRQIYVYTSFTAPLLQWCRCIGVVHSHFLSYQKVTFWEMKTH